MSNEKIARGLVEPIVWKPGESKVPDDCYDNAVNFVRDTFMKRLEELHTYGPTVRFGVVGNNKSLYDTFLENLPEEKRQYYNCNTCRTFVNKYGRLVIIDENGNLTSAMWSDEFDDVELGEFANVITALKRRVESSRVHQLFGTKGKDILGKEFHGGFRHFHININFTILSHLIAPSHISLGDFYGECQINFNMLKSFLQKYANAHGLEILSSIEEGIQYKVLSNYKDGKYYESLRELLSYDWGNLESTKVNNKIWYHVSRQDEFVKIKNSVLGMLFDDLDSGMDFDHAATRFNDAVDPLHYKRPDALPSITLVKEAQKVIDELGLEPSFHRRHALVSEIPLFWKPQEVVTEEKKEEPAGA